MAVPGTVMMWAGTLSNVPAGWLHCDGTALQQSEFPDLFAAIGFNFGANPPVGSFFLPDLRGRFIRGVDDGANRDPDVLLRVDMQDATIVSSTVGSVQSHAFENHTHLTSIFPGVAGNIASGTVWAQTETQTGPVTDPSFQTSSETRPINAYLFFLIRFAPESTS